MKALNENSLASLEAGTKVCDALAGAGLAIAVLEISIPFWGGVAIAGAALACQAGWI